jgi:cytochrome b6-f complex iron-sulfur subunit
VDAGRPGPTRRALLDWFLGTSVGALLLAMAYPLWRFMTPPRVAEPASRAVEAGTTADPDLLERGFKVVRFASEPVLLIRLSEAEYRAFSATCTHLDCIVEYQQKERRIWCNCHNGEYDLSGRNVAGPPPRPLRRFAVNVVARDPGEPGVIVISEA